jgi:hypothetical protein
MSKGNVFENDLLKIIFHNANIPLVGDATGLRGSTTPGDLYIALHTADVGEGGTQSTSETSYPGYIRVAVPRTTAAWTVNESLSQASNAAVITFPAATGGSVTISHVSVGTSSSGTGKVLYKGALPSPVVVSTGFTPTIAIGALIASED